ncbi:MAG: extracellular solute-binding protein [Candidatus Marinimicrobia bacterium]|nr:extracellular solute-binding protein [Candidatus Neomarinimicrobiota bacterium]MCF7829569.1 extracellular solute-binding protein [Candidatus Neomarinimicrobiota bacterium]MCF7882019.1 extracellular solute-binding protein [Candidatus Neomarinimicrobiota bacterium]
MSRSKSGKRLDSYSLIIVFLIIGVAIFLIINFIPSRHFNKSPRQITKLYYADNISPAHADIIRLFNEEYAGQIQVIPIDLSFDRFTTNERKELLARSLRSQNSRIDVFAVDVIWVPRFTRWALPLDEHLGDIARTQILDQAVTTAYYGGDLVSIPIYIDIGLMYYRRDLIRALPNGEELERKIQGSISWDELIRLHGSMMPSEYMYMFQGDQYEGIVCQFLEILASQEGAIFKDGQLDLTSEPAVNSLRYMVDLIYKYQMTPADVTAFREQESYRYAIRNDVPFLRGWPGVDQSPEDYGQDSTKVKELALAPFPHFGDHPSAGVFGGWNLMISKHTTKVDASVKFIRFFLSEESQQIMIDKGLYYPANKNFYEKENYIREYPVLQYYLSVLKQGVHRPQVENYTEISEVLAYFLNRALRREIDPAQALAKAEEMIHSNRVLVRE